MIQISKGKDAQEHLAILISSSLKNLCLVLALLSCCRASLDKGTDNKYYVNAHTSSKSSFPSWIQVQILLSLFVFLITGQLCRLLDTEDCHRGYLKEDCLFKGVIYMKYYILRSILKSEKELECLSYRLTVKCAWQTE